MSDPILDAIRKEKSCAVLRSIKAWAIGKGKWSDDLHLAAFEAKHKELEGRWK